MSTIESEKLWPDGECGCAPLIITASLKEFGCNVHGIDIDPSRFYSTISTIGLNMSKCDIETEPPPLDTVSCGVVIFKELFSCGGPLLTKSAFRRRGRVDHSVASYAVMRRGWRHGVGSGASGHRPGISRSKPFGRNGLQLAEPSGPGPVAAGQLYITNPSLTSGTTWSRRTAIVVVASVGNAADGCVASTANYSRGDR